MEIMVLKEKIQKMIQAKKNNGPEGPEKLLFMWVKQGHVNFKEFMELLSWLEDGIKLVDDEELI